MSNLLTCKRIYCVIKLIRVNIMAKRLDLTLVDRGLIDSRSRAKQLVENGCVFVDGKMVKKVSYSCGDDQSVEIKNDFLKYVSRAGNKLEKAIKVFDVYVKDKIVLDVGCSTGGFSDCALQNGAKRIVAVDVGSDQFSQKLRDDKRIALYENTDIRSVSDAVVAGAEIAVVDVSFISVLKIIERISKIDSIRELVVLIKPQFECGLAVAKKGKGIVRDGRVYADVISNIVVGFEQLGFVICGLDFSPILGGDGNIEFLSYFKRNKENHNKFDLPSAIKTVIENAKSFEKETRRCK